MNVSKFMYGLNNMKFRLIGRLFLYALYASVLLTSIGCHEDPDIWDYGYDLNIVFENEDGKNLVEDVCSCTLPQMQHDNELICVAPKLSKSATPEVKVVKDRTNIGYDRFFIHFGYLTKELEIRKVNYSIICKSLFGDTDPHQITTYWPEKTRDNTCGRFWATFYVRCMGVSIDGGEMIPVDSLNYVTVRLRNCL